MGDAAAADRAERKRKRKSRWGGDEKDKAFIPGMPTVIPPGLSKDQERLYLCKYRSRSVHPNTVLCKIYFKRLSTKPLMYILVACCWEGRLQVPITLFAFQNAI